MRRWTDATPELALPDLAGRRVDLRDFRGRVVLVNFWATWCEPCREEMPSIERLRTQLAGKPFEVLCVDYGESPERVKQFLEREMVDLPVLMDRDKEAAARWKAKGFPMTFLVDGRGKIRWWTYGARDWDKGEGAARVGELLAEVTGARR